MKHIECIADKCIGCGVCEKICPKNAITLVPKWFDFNYPVINNNLCINCGLCIKHCPTNNIKITENNKYYLAKNLNNDERMKSASGGIFSVLAKNIIKNNGIVFGAVFDENFNVIIKYTDSDYSAMIGSKYVIADIKNTYEECKNFLEQGKYVLYTGTPCQIYGLKTYLKKDYNNLYTVDVFCHGVPSNNAWQSYIKSFNKEIEYINFRDKRNGWENFNFTIKFKDGTELSEYHRQNEYMKLFLNNKILRKSCYECKFRKNQISDLSIGDAWGFEKSEMNDHHGLSNIIIRNDKILKFFDNTIMLKDADSIQTKQNISFILKIPDDRFKYAKLYTSLKENDYNIAISTHTVYKNVGGIIQAVSLYDKIKELYPQANIEFVNQKNNGHLKYFNQVKWVSHPANEQYTHLIAGSDQIWNHDYQHLVNFNDVYLNYNIKHKIAYAASFGHHNYKYNNNEIETIKKSLKNAIISTREISGTFLTEKWFNKKSIAVLDPTMLYDKNYYLNKINEKLNEQNIGIFKYVLDNNTEWNKIVNNISNNMHEPILTFDGSCEQFLSNFNKAKCIITDSFHGSVFSLIFNKPFICLRNKGRGNDRFDDLCLRFSINNRFIETLNDINYKLLNEKPNCESIIVNYRKESIDFLINAIKD